jgi:hypothetical protein
MDLLVRIAQDRQRRVLAHNVAPDYLGARLEEGQHMQPGPKQSRAARVQVVYVQVDERPITPAAR